MDTHSAVACAVGNMAVMSTVAGVVAFVAIMVSVDGVAAMVRRSVIAPASVRDRHTVVAVGGAAIAVVSSEDAAGIAGAST